MKKRLPNLKPERIATAAVSWLRERIAFEPALAWAAKKTVPVHRHRWIYFLGGAALFLFALQAVSGVLMMFYYQPTEAGAHASVRRITTEIPCGWLIRSMHVWGAHLFIATACLHFLTVLFTKSYRKPRELTWLSGVGMLAVALGSGFSGYLLPWTELSYFATRVGTEIPGTVPVVGDFIVRLLRGGEHVTGDTIARFYAAHVLIAPAALAGLLTVHLALIQILGMGRPLGMPDKEVRDHRPFFTEFALLESTVWLVLFGILATLAVFLPAEVGTRADPLASAPKGIKPEWFFLFMFETLKLLPELWGVALMGLGAIGLVLVPFLDRNASCERRSPRFTALYVVVLIYAVSFELLGILTPGVKHSAEEIPIGMANMAYRIVSLALLWFVIAFLVYYLRKLFHQNARLRQARLSATGNQSEEA